MGAPKGNCNACKGGSRGSVSRGAKGFLAKKSGRKKFVSEFKKNWGKGSTKWEIRKALSSYRSRKRG